MARSESDRKYLENELLKLLGSFANSEDVVDIFEQLIQIEADEDLQEYVSGLLGQTEKVYNFIINLQRWRLGSSLIIAEGIKEEVVEKTPEEKYEVTTKKKATTRPRPRKKNVKSFSNSKAAKKNIEKKSTNVVASGSVNSRRENVEEKSTMNKNLEKNEKKTTPKCNNEVNAQQRSQTVYSTSSSLALNKEIHKALNSLRTGETLIICGCFGTKHEAVTNCLYCGRIICEKEGYGSFCPHCSRFISENHVTDVYGKNISEELQNSIKHKNKLLTFERESAKRTQVFDDQKDYYSSTWLSKEERDKLYKMEQIRKKQLHERKKASLNDFIPS